MQSPAGRMQDYGRLFGDAKTCKPRHIWNNEQETGANPSRLKKLSIIDHQRRLRKSQTTSERRTKFALLKLYGLPHTAKRDEYKRYFIDQYVVWIGKQAAIIDFLIVKGQIGIEVDGGYHSTKEQHRKDAERTKQLNYEGIKIRRIENYQTRDRNTLDTFLAKCIADGEKRLAKRISEAPPPPPAIKRRPKQSIPDGAVKVQPGVYVRFK